MSMSERKSVSKHFLFCLLCAPAFFDHPIGRDHHACSVVTHTAMDEYLLARVFADQSNEFRKNFILGKGALPGHGDILDAKASQFLAFNFPISPQVDHDLNTHLCQGFKSMFFRFTPTVKRGSNFAKIRYQ